MARWISGSAKIRAKTNASRPPIAPASAPNAMNERGCGTALPCPSVAGEAEEVPRVVHELVDGGVDAEDGHHALVDADEVVRENLQHSRADQPERRAGERDDDGRPGGGGGAGHAAHGVDLPPGIPRPRWGCGQRKEQGL